MGLISGIIGTVFNLGSAGLSLAASNIPDEVGDSQRRDNDLYGDITNAGYLPGVSAGFDSEIQHNFYTYEPVKKQRLQKASMWMSTIGSSFGGIASAFDQGRTNGPSVTNEENEVIDYNDYIKNDKFLNQKEYGYG